MANRENAVAQLRSMWEFAATWKVLSLLSSPLSFSPPAPSALEAALLEPENHMQLIANMHGRLLGISAGVSASKKWLQAVGRFIRQRPDEFSFLEAEDAKPHEEKPEQLILKKEGGKLLAKNEPLKEGAEPSGSEFTVGKGRYATLPQFFPNEEDLYHSLRSDVRLLVLHTIAELVISEPDSLLSAGTIADIGLDDMRIFPVGSDAVGNQYWYFNDFERVYREPGEQDQRTRRQKAEDEAKVAAAASREAEAEAARITKEARRAEKRREKEEIERRRVERKKKSLERWAPRAAARRSTRASSRAGDPNGSSADRCQSVGRLGNDNECRDEEVDIEGGYEDGSVGEEQAELIAEIFGEPDPMKLDDDAGQDNPGRRTSGRKRKKLVETELHPPPAPHVTKTPRRPRRGEHFLDPTLRNCNAWEAACIGADSLRELIERFQPNGSSVLSSERTLVRRLEEHVLPPLTENEEKTRREQEKIERKQRVEAMFSNTKRSSRVQALTLKREEEARRIAEEEEEERQRQQKIANHAESVHAEIVALEKWQSRDIRAKRRSHGRTDAIERDDEIPKPIETQTCLTDASGADGLVRRSTRSTRSSLANRGSRRSSRVVKAATSGQQCFKSDETSDSDVATDYGNMGNAVSNTSNALAHGEGEREVSNTLEDSCAVQIHPPDSGSGVATSDDLRKAVLREDVLDDTFTWASNPEDEKPMRVLSRYFFASKADFSDAPLELSEVDGTHLIGYGILVPPPNSLAGAQRVELQNVADWSIEYGEEPKLWAKSHSGWYELREPAKEYCEAFKSTRRKYELCARIQILGDCMKSPQLTYSEVVDLLSLRYENMLAYSEMDILKEKQFIIAQLTALKKRTLMNSGFLKDLQKRAKSEAAKATAEQRKLLIQKDKKQAAANQMALANADCGTRPVDMATDVLPHKRQPKPNGASSSRKPVPRAVTVLVNSILRAVTKSQASRKRRRKPETHSSRDGPKVSTSLPNGQSTKNGQTPNASTRDDDEPLVGNGPEKRRRIASKYVIPEETASNVNEHNHLSSSSNRDSKVNPRVDGANKAQPFVRTSTPPISKGSDYGAKVPSNMPNGSSESSARVGSSPQSDVDHTRLNGKPGVLLNAEFDVRQQLNHGIPASLVETMPQTERPSERTVDKLT